ncbi:MAG: hypothetical protein EBY29_05995 [Planctomycetes bacterium]|nr:hypothetical protein [Planctomycetota bacterium]
MKPILEVPVDSIAGAMMAAPFADRLELCDDLSSEGWTPTITAVAQSGSVTWSGVTITVTGVASVSIDWLCKFDIVVGRSQA